MMMVGIFCYYVDWHGQLDIWHHMMLIKAFVVLSTDFTLPCVMLLVIVNSAVLIAVFQACYTTVFGIYSAFLFLRTGW